MFRNVLLIGKHWPECRSSAAGTRTLQILNHFRPLCTGLHFATAAQPGEHSDPLPDVHTHQILLNDSSFDSWIAGLKPDVVIFDRFMTEEQFSWRVREQCPDAIRILDTSDIHCLRERREKQLDNQGDNRAFTDVTFREISAVFRSDLSLIISSYEMGWLQKNFQIPSSQLLHLPFSASAETQQNDFAARQHLCFIGGFQHKPNLNAVEWLYRDIWPLIRKKHPQLQCHIWGAYMPRRIRQMHNPARGFYCMGRAGDARETLRQYRLNLAPLRYGAGNKGKVIDGFATGTPTIMTEVASEGMALGHRWRLSPANTSDTFAQYVHEALESEELWRDLRDEGFHILNTFNHPERLQRRLTRSVTNLQTRLPYHRSQLFFCQLLWQQQFRASEFMSRWIEEKNRHLPC